MHVSVKQIQMLTTFDKYNLLLSLYIYMLVKILIFYFSNVYRYFATSLREKVKRVTIRSPPRHARARPLTYLR
jgi:hypothetical protein